MDNVTPWVSCFKPVSIRDCFGRTDEVSSFMDSVYDTYNNDAVIQFNGIFQQKDSRRLSFC
jgi:hypothetical protein